MPKNQPNCKKDGLKIYQAFTRLPTLCAKAVGQLGNNINAGKGPRIFSEQGRPT